MSSTVWAHTVYGVKPVCPSPEYGLPSAETAIGAKRDLPSAETICRETGFQPNELFENFDGRMKFPSNRPTEETAERIRGGGHGFEDAGRTGASVWPR